MMCKMTKDKGIKMTREWLNEMGKAIQFFPGVLDWFDRINAFGESQGVRVEHYLVSSGNKEIVEGSAIAKKFKVLYACEFLYDKDGRTDVAETRHQLHPKDSVFLPHQQRHLRSDR
jgi:hypothetical protein